MRPDGLSSGWCTKGFRQGLLIEPRNNVWLNQWSITKIIESNQLFSETFNQAKALFRTFRKFTYTKANKGGLIKIIVIRFGWTFYNSSALFILPCGWWSSKSQRSDIKPNHSLKHCCDTHSRQHRQCTLRCLNVTSPSHWEPFQWVLTIFLFNSIW